jgi:hypothetical protein
MTPPYVVIDKGDGNKEVTNEIPATAGDKFEIFKNGVARVAGPFGPTSTSPPVEEPPTTTEPNPTPQPIPTGDGMDRPTTEAQLRDALETYRLEKRVGILDGRCQIEISQTIQILAAGAGEPWGVNGNYAKIKYVGSGGHDMLVFRGTKGKADRCLVVEKLTLFGGGYDRNPAGACLKISAPEGDPGSFYKSKIADVYTHYATRGVVLEGAVFESYLENVHAENHRSHGMDTSHTYTTGEHNGIISNINIMHPNFSRNKGAGLRCTYSTNVQFGSFVLNAEGGVLAPDGLRYAAANNGENTGEALFVIPSNGYGSLLVGNEVSSDGSTCYRAFEGGQWVTYGKPCLYLLSGHANVIEKDGHCSYYGSAATSPMRVRK